MFSILKNAFGNITIDVKNGIVYAEGIRADIIAKDIRKVWGSSVDKNIFVDIGKYSFSFYDFYCLEVFYIIENLICKTDIGSTKRVLRELNVKLLESTWINNLQKEFPSKLHLEHLSKFHKSPLPEQKRFLLDYDQTVQQYELRGKILAAAAGGGKEQPLDALIKTPEGWITMGEVQVGQLVTAKDGTPCKVTGVYPQGIKEIFKITFADGRTAECGIEHLWNIYRSENNTYIKETVNLKTIIDYLNIPNIQNKLFIDLIEPEQIKDKKLKTDPYTVGINTGIDLKHKEFTPAKNFKFDMLNVYLNCSAKQRLSLVQGLMDITGTVDVKGQLVYTTVNHDLALKMVYLIRSLGGIASLTKSRSKVAFENEKMSNTEVYNVNIVYKNPTDLFKLPNKKQKAKENAFKIKELKLRIVKVESVGFKEAQCIMIDHPEHLYVTDSFVVTHNTIASLMLMSCLEVNKTIVVCPKNALNLTWNKTISNEFKTQPKLWTSDSTEPMIGDEDYFVVHYEGLTKFLAICDRIKDKKIGIILDESHNLNTHDSMRTLAFIELCNRINSNHILWLSGTPIKALATEAIPLFRTMDKRFTARVEESFKKIFGISKERATDILKNRLGNSLFVVAKTEQNLDDVIQKEIKVKMPNGEKYTLDNISKDMARYAEERFAYYKTREAEDKEFFSNVLKGFQRTLRNKKDYDEFLYYQECLSKVIKYSGDSRFVKEEMKFCNKYESTKIIPTLSREDKIKFKEVKTIIKYVKLKVQGEVLGRIVSKARIDCHVELCKYVDYKSILDSSEKKTIIFTSFINVLTQLKETLANLNLDAKFVYGDTNKDLNNIVNSFANDPNVNPLVATYASLSTAVPMTMANQIITINLPFRDYILQQTIARVHRIGQDSQCVVYNAILDTNESPNISTRSKDILTWSTKQVEAITGVPSPYEINENIEQSDFSLEEFNDHIDRVTLTVEEYVEDKKECAIPSYSAW